jgi:hypothetical protein
MTTMTTPDDIILPGKFAGEEGGVQGAGGAEEGDIRSRGEEGRTKEVLAHVLQDVLRHVLQASRPAAGDGSGSGGGFHEKVGWLCGSGAREK